MAATGAAPTLQQRRCPSQPRRRPSKAVYRRRRLAVLACLLAAAIASWLGFQQLTGSSGDGPLTVAGRPGSAERSSGSAAIELDSQLVTVTRAIVQPGDTLWSIARRVQPSGDVRPLVAKLESGRDGRALQVGERIAIPRH